VALAHELPSLTPVSIQREVRESARLILRPVPPFRLEFTVWALRRRARNQIDRWDGAAYRRLVVVGGRHILLAITQGGTIPAPEVIVDATPGPRSRMEEDEIRSIVDRLLGLRVDLGGWYQTSTRDSRLRLIADKFRGLKPPRFPTMFEAVVNAFACQQLSLEVGLELLNRLAAAATVAVGTPSGTYHPFPAPRDLASLAPQEFRVLGFSRQKAAAIRELAESVADDRVDLELLASQEDAEAVRHLTALRGVGRWTAEYALLRGLGRLNVFPGDDVGAQKRLASWLGDCRPMRYDDVVKAVQRWQPYAGFVYLHLLLEGLSQNGVVSPGRLQSEPVHSL
jgi:DNA-3-methyladenine glycosylase II